ncbi:hypothetical protein QLQ15_13165 [Lysobacter sp. LF1]|uniref:HTH cro/C1-type domain-containing protein n=1 Tax=Lysobacter stagni TaxID=3045172 RepID=A0ABT6XJB1_9GAMM|nr:hypothetical protein [Lysobacter sp. LF1]MDI9239855.1 hypothetical protein [Lysobacter sp. LF1]
MNAIANLLDKAKTTKGIPSDNAFAVAMGWRRQVISQWRSGDSYPSEDNIAQLAEVANEDVVKWLVTVKAERTDGPAGKAWARLARQLGTAAALALVALLPFGNVSAKSITTVDVVRDECILCKTT